MVITLGFCIYDLDMYVSLSEDELLVHQDYLDYFGILKDLTRQQKSIIQVDGSQVDKLFDIAEGDHGMVSAYARNILHWKGVINYKEPILLPENLKSGNKNPLYKGIDLNKGVIKLFPNPAKDFITVEYNLSDLYREPQKIVIFVNSADGKQVDTRIADNLQDQFILETSTYKPGVYVLSLKVKDKIIHTAKFTVSQ